MPLVMWPWRDSARRHPGLRGRWPATDVWRIAPGGYCARSVEWASHTSKGLPQDMRIYLGRAQVRMSQQLLYGSDVRAAMQQFRRKTVAKGVATRGLAEASTPYRTLYRPLHSAYMHVMPHHAAIAVLAQAFGRPQPLPLRLLRAQAVALSPDHITDLFTEPGASNVVMHDDLLREMYIYTVSSEEQNAAVKRIRTVPHKNYVRH